MLGGSAAGERMVMEKYFTGGKNMTRGKLIFMSSFLCCHIINIKKRGSLENEEKNHIRDRFKKKNWEKKLTNVSFMYVCVAGNGEMLVFFFLFSPNNSLIDNSLSE